MEFTFITVEGRAVPNKHANRGTFPVYLIDELGNKWFEDAYEGKGVFGGKPFRRLAKEMTERMGAPAQPILSENPNTVWSGQKMDVYPLEGFYYEEEPPRAAVPRPETIKIVIANRVFDGEQVQDLRTLRLCTRAEFNTYKSYIEYAAAEIVAAPEFKLELFSTEMVLPRDAKYLVIPIFRQEEMEECGGGECLMPNIFGAYFVKSRADVFRNITQKNRAKYSEKYSQIWIIEKSTLAWELTSETMVEFPYMYNMAAAKTVIKLA
jgi:hypothetical protein